MTGYVCVYELPDAEVSCDGVHHYYVKPAAVTA